MIELTESNQLDRLLFVCIYANSWNCIKIVTKGFILIKSSLVIDLISNITRSRNGSVSLNYLFKVCCVFTIIYRNDALKN